MRPQNMYTLENPAFDAKRLTLYHDIYHGLASPGVVENYLFRNDSESLASYETRMRRRAYINLAAPVADLFSSVATGNVNRSGVSAFEAMLKNCDRRGNAPDVFFKRVGARVSPMGAHFVLVDMPPAKNAARSMSDAAARGLAPYFVSVAAEDLYAWDYEPDGSLAYCIIRGKRHQSSGPFTPFAEVETREVWTKTGWQRLESRDGREFALVGEGEHPCGVVPVVPFLFEEVTPMTGLSVFDDVAENMVQLFNCWSELDKSLADSSLPWLWLKGVNPEQALKLIRSSDSAIVTDNPDADGKYLETSGISFAAKMNQIETAVKYITNVSLRRTRPDSAAAVSAESKREDNRELVSLMKDFAANLQAAERRCWQLAGKWLGMSESEVEDLHVSYEVQYDEDEVSEGAIQTLIDLVTHKVFSAQFIRDILYRTEFVQSRLTPEQAAMDFDPVEEQAKIDNEARGGASGGMGGMAGNVAAILGGGSA